MRGGDCDGSGVDDGAGNGGSDDLGGDGDGGNDGGGGSTPFAVHYEKIRNHLRETATNSAKIHSLARKFEHSGINQIQIRFLHFNQHSITLLGIHVRH